MKLETLKLLDDVGSPGATVSNGPRYFGFVIGASLPAAAAAERLLSAWDQCASSYVNSPVAATLENVAARWLLDILELPEESAVGFGTSATACGLSCLATARRSLLVALVVTLVTGASPGVADQQRVKVAMRDGVKIDTYFRTPVGDGPWPAVLKKGYGITIGDAETFVKAGYAFGSTTRATDRCRSSNPSVGWIG